MPSAFTLFGELKADTGAFERSLKEADLRLKSTQTELTKTEAKSKSLGDTSATVGRRYEKLNEAILHNRDRLSEAAKAYVQGEISAKKYASVLASVENQTRSLTSRIKDANARASEIKLTGLTHFQNQIKGATSELSNLAAIFTGNRLSGATSQITSLGNATSGMIDLFKGAGTASGELAEGAAAASFALGPVAIAIAAVTGAATLGTIALAATGKQLFDMAQSASEAGSLVKDFQDKTDLAADTIQALKFAAAQSGIDLDALATPVRKLTQLMFQASEGNKKAIETLAKFGVTDFSNIDGALSKVIAKLGESGDAVNELGLASEVFGAKNAQVMKAVADNTGGNLDSAIAKAKELGIVLSQEAVDNADQFGDTLEVLNTQLKAAANVIALEFAPVFTEVMSEISELLAANKDNFKLWGEGIRAVLHEVITDVKLLASFLKNTSEAGIAYAQGDYLEVIRSAARQAEESRKILEDARNTPISGSAIGKSGNRFADDSASPLGNISAVLGALPELEEAYKQTTKLAEDAEKARKDASKKAADEAIKQAKEWVAHIKDAMNVAKDIFSKGDNPFTKIFDDAEKSIQKVREATRGLGSDIQKTLVGMVQQQAQAAAFAQNIQNKLQALGLRNDARQFAQGYLDDPNNNALLQQRIKSQIDAVLSGADGRRISISGDSEIAQKLRASISSAFADPLKQAAADKAIIGITQGLDPSKAGSEINKIAAEARNREADRLEKQLADESADRKRLNTILTSLESAVKTGAVVKILDETNGRVNITRPTAANVGEKYK